MSPRAPFAAAVLAAAALTAPAHAQDLPRCAAVATPPHADPAGPGLRASGTFGCFKPSWDHYVEVCVEQSLPRGSWVTLGCSAIVQNDGGGWATAEVTVAAPDETAVLRTTAFGSNERGETARATSAPVVWPGCGCP